MAAVPLPHMINSEENFIHLFYPALTSEPDSSENGDSLRYDIGHRNSEPRTSQDVRFPITKLEPLMNQNHPSPSHRVVFNGMRPLALSKRQTVAALGSSKLVTRMLWASRHADDSWLLIVRQGRDLLIDTESVEVAYDRLLRGEHPPLMPCERRTDSENRG